MANFNTVAGCFLASALFALVVGKVSNAVVDPHHLEKPAIAVSDEAPAEAAPAGGAPAELAPIGPKLASANVDNGKALFQKLCFTCHTVAPTRSAPTSGTWSAARRPAKRASATRRHCRPRAARGATKTSTT